MKYYYLMQRDTIKEGDEVRKNWGDWDPVKPEWVGRRKGSIMGWKYKIRRQVKEVGDEE